MLLAAMAGGMGWGIRGQYGHETGAMIAGLLVGLTLVLLFYRGADSLSAARAVAWCTVAMGFGGSMTYGQTIGLTQNAAMIGRWEPLLWGMLGLGLKGGIWIGFAGVFLGMGLGGVRYRPRELLALLGAMLGLFVLGMWLLNEPFRPQNRVLPAIYFSADWRWEPGADLRPRRECWGGLLFALAAVVIYAGALRRDRLAGKLAGWGFLGGALGFPLGQCVQAFHAWNPVMFREGWLRGLDPHINWWNMMETTFGAILALGLWRNRRQLAPPSNPDEVKENLRPETEWLLFTLAVGLLVGTEFVSFPVWLEPVVDVGLVFGVIPIVASSAGRWWPYLAALPLTVLPIAGKTVQRLVYAEQMTGPVWGWLVYGVLPLAVTTMAAVRFFRTATTAAAHSYARPALLLTTWLYFGLNFAFFDFPWPWDPWTVRTPSAILFAGCAIGLSMFVLKVGTRESFPGRS